MPEIKFLHEAPLCEYVDSMSKENEQMLPRQTEHCCFLAPARWPVSNLQKSNPVASQMCSRECELLSPRTGGFLIPCHLPGLLGRHSVSHWGTPMEAHPRAEWRARPPDSSLSAPSTNAQLFSRSPAQEMLLENAVRISVVGNLFC